MKFEKLLGLLEGTPHETSELSDLAIGSSGATFDNAAQVWNHTFYWHRMAPDGGDQPSGRIDQMLVRSFGSLATFQNPLLGMDEWEHAHHLDYQNARQRYVEAFLSHLANWRFANENLDTCTPKDDSRPCV